MKKAFNIYTMTTALLLFSCESYVTGINENDITRIQDADLKLVVVAAELNYSGFLEGQPARLASLWGGYFSGKAKFDSYHNYNITAGDFNVDWNNLYTYTLKPLRISRQKAQELSNLSIVGICQVMEASIMTTAISLWGDVPYSEATNLGVFDHPIYESQLAVVDKLLPMLDEAVINLSAGAPKARTADFLFPLANFPTNAQWIATAYSVKARLLLHKKDYANALLAANLGILLPADDLQAKHGTSLNIDVNLYYDFIVRKWQGTLVGSNTFLGKLLNATEPGNRNHNKTNEGSRLAKYYSGTTVASYMPNTSSTGYFALSAPFPLHTAFETKLIAAECLIRMGDFTNALIKLNEHRANLRTTYPAGTYTDFMASDFDPAGIENAAGTLTASDALLREILEEKYVCLYGQIEGFTEVRRTNNALGFPPNAGTEIPQRFLYSQTEINANLNTPNPIPGLFEKTTIFQ